MVKTQKKTEVTWKSYFSSLQRDYDIKSEGIAIGEKRGKKLGRSEGEAARAIAAAKNLLAMKILTNEQIAQAVGLPLGKIEELAAEHL